ncbi:MAG: hypothetical protein RLZZ210_1267 [Pseudomonadota bacterium]
MHTINILGGTFSPPHLAHTQMIERINNICNPDINYIIPALAWQKVGVLDANHRLEMCNIAFNNLQNTKISNFEIEKNKPSFTIETLAQFRQNYPNSKIYFTLGFDQLINLHTWHKWQELTQYANLYILQRNSNNINNLNFNKFEYKDNLLNAINQEILAWIKPKLKTINELSTSNNLSGDVILDDWQPLNISSTKVRELIKQSDWQSLEQYLDKDVIKYIIKYNLYV